MLDHPASDKAPFGQAVRARSELGGGWLGWVVAVDDIAAVRGAPRPRGRRRQPAPSRRSRAALEAARRQGPAVRPAAAVLRAVGGRPGRPPEHRRLRRRLTSTASRSPATPTGSASGSASPSSARWRTSRSTGSPPNGTPGIVAAQFSTPQRRGPHLSRAARPRRGAIPLPNIWDHPAVYELENRAVDPGRAIDEAMPPVGRLARPRRARRRLRLRLPPAPSSPRPAPLGRRASSRTPAWCALARRRTRGSAVSGAAGRGPGPPAARRAPSTWPTPGGPTSSARAASRGCASSTASCGRGGTRVRRRQRRHPLDLRALVPPAATRRSTRPASSGSGPRAAGSAPRSTMPWRFASPRRLRGGRPHRVRPPDRRRDPRRARGPRGRLRRQPCGPGSSERRPRSRELGVRITVRVLASSAPPSGPRAGARSATATSSSGCRTEVSPGDDLGRRESSKPTTATSAAGPQPPLVDRLDHADGDGVAGADERLWRRARAARGPPCRAESTLSVTRAPSRVVESPPRASPSTQPRAPVLADARGLLPARPRRPAGGPRRQVLDGEPRARRAVDVDPGVVGHAGRPRAGRRRRTARRCRATPPAGCRSRCR